MIRLFRQSPRLAAEVTQAGDEGPALPLVTAGDGRPPSPPIGALVLVTPALVLSISSEATGASFPAFPPQKLESSLTS